MSSDDNTKKKKNKAAHVFDHSETAGEHFRNLSRELWKSQESSEADKKHQDKEKKSWVMFHAMSDELQKIGGMPPPLPAAAVKNPMAEALFSGMKAAPKTVKPMAALLPKTAALTTEARNDLPKKDFAVPASKSNTGSKAYPIPDEQHARSALGFAKMHGDTSDYARVRAKVQARFPHMLKGKEAAVAEAIRGAMSGEAGKHITELAGLGLLAAPSMDQLQAHVRAATAGQYDKEGVKQREFLPAVSHPLAEAGGLGILMAPEVKDLLHLRGK